MNTNPNAYITCLTEENEIKMRNSEDKLDKGVKKFMVK